MKRGMMLKWLVPFVILGCISTAGAKSSSKTAKEKGRYMGDKIVKTDSEWQKSLTPEQYKVLRKHGTEAPFKGKYWDNHEKGIYSCSACGLELYSSDTTF
ncbi:MAG TPA: peptide-methionine (R)-S-oxide reductase, partial [bacterium]